MPFKNIFLMNYNYFVDVLQKEKKKFHQTTGIRTYSLLYPVLSLVLTTGQLLQINLVRQHLKLGKV